MKDVFRVRRMWRPRSELKDRYDVVIVGGGFHGLAIAYYLAKNHGITDVAVLEKSYIGSGAAGRKTTIIRANYRTPEGAEFYKESVKLYEGLGADLDFNLLFSQQGHLDARALDRGDHHRQRARGGQPAARDRSRVIYPDEIAKLCPEMDLSENVTWPVQAALYHPPGGIIRHDAVVWGYARGVDRQGIEIHPHTEVTGIERSNGRVTGVETTRGHVKTDMVVSATAGWSTLVADLAGVPLPIIDPHPAGLRDRAGEAVPRRDHRLRHQMHVYVSQTDRGEFLIGAEIEPYTTYNGQGTLSLPRVLGRATSSSSSRSLERHPGAAFLDGPLRPLPTTAPSRHWTELDGFLARPAGAPTASRRRRSSARRSRSSSPPARRQG